MGIRRVQLSIYSVRKNMYTGILSFRALAFFNHKLLLIEQGWGNSRSGFQDIPASAQGYPENPTCWWPLRTGVARTCYRA
ncbi:hypothetical protein FKM82_015526 [Ascaphus truei]